MQIKVTDIRTISSVNITTIFLTIFTFLTFFFPDSYRVVRLIVLLLLTFTVIVEHPRTFFNSGLFYVLALIIANIFFLLWGLINDAPGAVRSQTVDLLWPILFYIVTQAIDREYKFLHLEKVMVFSYFFVCLFDVLYIVSSLTGISFPFFNVLTEVLDCHFGNYGSFMQYTTSHMCTHIFMVPFVISLLRSKDVVICKGFLYIIVGMAVTCVLVSGRVALILTSVVCSLVGLYLMKEKKGGIKLKSFFRFLVILFVIVIGIGIISNYLGIQISSIMNYIVQKFVTSQDPAHPDNGVRMIQKEALLQGWVDSPIIGHGTGSYTPLCIRDENQLWAYEYSYYALLFQKGLIGFLVTFALYGWILITLLKKRRIGKLRTSIAVPFFVGFVAILIANHADPYLAKLGCMWMIFYPFAVANVQKDSLIKYKNKEEKNLCGAGEIS